MVSPNIDNDLKFSGPAKYRICVKGFLDESWSDRLAGMQITTDTTATISPATIIGGELRDQSELIGVLNSLYELHLPLVSVSLLENDVDATN